MSEGGLEGGKVHCISSKVYDKHFKSFSNSLLLFVLYCFIYYKAFSHLDYGYPLGCRITAYIFIRAGVCICKCTQVHRRVDCCQLGRNSTQLIVL